MGFTSQFLLIDETNNDQLMKVYINDKDRIFIETGALEGDDHFHCGFVTLDKSDAIALKKELERLIKIL